MANVAQAIVETLIAAKVRRIYGLVGDSLNALTDALRHPNRSSGSACGTKRWRRSPPARTRT